MPIPMTAIFKNADDKSPAFDDIKEYTNIHNVRENITVVCLEGGMGSGLPSVAIRSDLDNGDIVISETSARLFCTAAKAIMARYPNLFEGD
jgi:hypothetical protein